MQTKGEGNCTIGSLRRRYGKGIALYGNVEGKRAETFDWKGSAIAHGNVEGAGLVRGKIFDVESAVHVAQESTIQWECKGSLQSLVRRQ